MAQPSRNRIAASLLIAALLASHDVAHAATAPAADTHAEPHAAHATRPMEADKPGKAAKVDKSDKSDRAGGDDKADKAAKADKVESAASAASAAETPLDRLRRRLGETMGDSGRLQERVPGELRVTTRVAAAQPARQPVRAPHAHGAHSAHGSDGHASAHKPAHAAPHAHWSYEGVDGPEAWGRLDPAFAACSSGKRQSPIDIRDGIEVQLDAIRFDYRPSRFGVIDNGHTVQVNVAGGNAIEVNGRRYGLVQFHFHRPSEERIDGKPFDMVAHLVHKDAEGRLAVVAVLLERGSAQPVVQQVWNNLPLEEGEEQPAQAAIDVSQLLPSERGYFTYMGSLTTPPCSEGVLWLVMRKPVAISPEQLAIFTRLYPMNARPIQPASGRMIKASE